MSKYFNKKPQYGGELAGNADTVSDNPERDKREALRRIPKKERIARLFAPRTGARVAPADNPTADNEDIQANN